MRAKFISVSLISLILFAGCNSIEPDKKSILSINDIKRAFANTGLELIPAKETIKKDLWINGVKPAVFKMDQYFDDRLFVYVFKSSEERKKGKQTILNNITPFQDYINKESTRPRDFETKNVLLIYTEKEAFMRYSKKIENILVNQLNEGQIFIYEGQGKYWVATYQYNFYGKSDTSDKYCIEEATLSYIGENPENIGRMNFKLESPTHGYFGNDTIAPKGGKLYFGGTGGPVYQELPNGKEEIKLYVKWQDKEENFELKLKE